MTLDYYDGLDLALLTVGYWVADKLVHQDGWLELWRKLRVERATIPTAVWIVGLLPLSWFWRWEQLAQGDAIRLIAVALVAILTWKAVTMDVDPVANDRHGLQRLLLVGAAVGVWLSPACLLVAGFLLTTPFGVWEHHATMPMRVVQALMAYVVLAGTLAPATPLFADAAVLFYFVLTIQISHYLITALAKALLGPRWYSWVTDNRLHHLAASAYSWGWARWWPWSTWRKVIRLLKVAEKPMQLSAFSVELLAPLALLHPYAAMAFCVGWSAFHMGVFSCSGLLFWEWALTNLAVAAAIFLLPDAVTAQLFGPLPAAVAVVFMLLFPLRHKLWKPMPLGWWDTPFTQRIHWHVHGVSGELYALYNDFMGPHERIYGKVNGCFLAPVPVVTYHLGEVWKHELRDALRDAGPDLERLAEVRQRFGIDPKNAAMTANHEAYLRRFFHEVNRGTSKSVLPSWLRWLKAPGGQLFYWGELPRFVGQEQAVRLSMVYREEYFDGEELQRLTNETVHEIDLTTPLPAADESAPLVRELTPKEIDDYLLGLAAGRLIDLPGFSGGYVEGDDGKTREAAS